jgi:hypothetical protein
MQLLPVGTDQHSACPVRPYATAGARVTGRGEAPSGAERIEA